MSGRNRRNGQDTRCPSGAGRPVVGPYHSAAKMAAFPVSAAAASTRSAPKYYGAERSILAKGMFIAANRSQCGSMIYTFYMFCTDKSKSGIENYTDMRYAVWYNVRARRNKE